MLDEEIEFPRELLDIEGDAVGQVGRRGEFSPPPLERGNERDRLPVQRRMFGGARGAQMRLQGDVAQIGQREHTEIVGVPEHCRNRHRHFSE